MRDCVVVGPKYPDRIPEALSWDIARNVMLYVSQASAALVGCTLNGNKSLGGVTAYGHNTRLTLDGCSVAVQYGGAEHELVSAGRQGHYVAFSSTTGGGGGGAHTPHKITAG
jgi:hypothetical protein